MRRALVSFCTKGRNYILFCHFFRKSSAKIGLSRIAHPSWHYCHRDGLQGTLKAISLSDWMRFGIPKLCSFKLASILATTIFFWFFSYEKEKNELRISLPLF